MKSVAVIKILLALCLLCSCKQKESTNVHASGIDYVSNDSLPIENEAINSKSPESKPGTQNFIINFTHQKKLISDKLKTLNKTQANALYSSYKK